MIIVASLVVKSKSRIMMTNLLDALKINIDFLSSEATDDMKLSVLRDSREIIDQMIDELCGGK